MKRWLAGALAPLSLLFLFVGSAAADTVVETTSPTGADSVVWSQLGAIDTTVASISATSLNGVGVTSPDAVEVFTNGTTAPWFGNFSPGEYVIFTLGASTLTLDFSEGVSEVGAQIMANDFGSFTGQIQAFAGGTLLGTFSEGGVSNNNNDGSAIFLGARDSTGANITSAVFTAGTSTDGFAIGTLNLDDSPTSAPTPSPEPTTLLMMASGLAAVFGLAKREGLKV
jgi:hypothetical protein